MKKLLYLLIAVCTMFASCKKKGCTDNNANNYCSKCNSDDGSCEYTGRVVFWFDHATADSLQAYSITSLTFYINGVVVGSCASSVYFASAPDCGTTASVTTSQTYTGDKNKTMNFVIKDQTNNVVWSGQTTYQSNVCKTYQLTW